MFHQTRSIKELERIAALIRLHIVEMVGVGQRGHLGGSCSAADIVTALYFAKMRHDPADPAWPDRDRFLLSKGHSALAQYAALAECGYFPKHELKKVKTLGAMLQGHPDRLKTPGIEANTGSLGQGISIACGMAAGLRIDGRESRVYCILGDGEAAEGQVWEASHTAAFYKLDNLVAILDNNRLMATGPIARRYDTSPYPEKWRAFGWHVLETDGHNIAAILEALDAVNEIQGKPKMVIAHTIKGKGISFAENRPEFHNGILNAEQFAQACRELGKEQ
ncbi:MAG: transketolase [Acidobacteriia bacterium]|nr:transketolase [Terriglobia bacterium]